VVGNLYDIEFDDDSSQLERMPKLEPIGGPK
jgi:hypothetical protein